MDEEIERLVVSVRADTSAFARDVASMRGELEGPLVAGAGRAGRLIDSALAKAIITGKTGFDDLKKVALAAMSDIAQMVSQARRPSKIHGIIHFCWRFSFHRTCGFFVRIL